MRLSRKRIFITGSSSGVGLEIARRFQSEGATVALHSHLPRDRCPQLRPLFADTVAFFEQDLTQLDQLDALIGRVWDTLGGIDVIVLNAGTFHEPQFLELDIATLQRTYALNCLAPVLLIRAWAARCVETSLSGSAICTTSVNAVLSEPGHTAYDGSKGGLNASVRGMAVDLARHRLTVNAVSLGLVRTPLTAAFIDGPGVRAQLDQRILLGVTEPNDVTGIYVHLASDDARATTGAIFPVDGGISATQATVGV